jgi:hypothetical protein
VSSVVQLLFLSRQWKLLLALIAAHGALTSEIQAQVAPNESYRTIKTEHFYVHFTPPLEEAARRAAVYAENAHRKLSEHLTPARGKIDMILADNIDLANGSATPFPSNRIVIFASPPVFQNALRFTDDPLELVVVHELVHVFHLDRSRGVWKLLQMLTGRTPFFFPNIYEPSWLVEGLAVYYESLITGSGRIAGSEHRMIAEAAAVAHLFPRIDQLSLARPHFPYGESAYAFGSLFIDHLARTHGDSAMKRFVEAMSAQIIPWALDIAARRAFRASFAGEYRKWADSLVRHAPPWAPPMPGWRDLTVDGAYANHPRWLNDTSLVYTGTPGRESYGAYRLTLKPTSDVRRPTSPIRERIGRRNTRSPNTVLSDGSLLYSQNEFTSPYHIRSDLYVDRRHGGTKRLTRGARLAIPDARSDGLIVAVQMVPNGTRIALVSADGARITPITAGSLDEQWTEPRWSPDGRHIAASRWTRGATSEIVVIDTAGRIVQTLVRERALSTTPSWSRDGRYVYFSSDRDGLPDLYRAAFTRAFADTMMVPAIQRVSDARTGLFEAQPSPDDSSIAAVVFKADGYHIGVAPIAASLPGGAEARSGLDPRPPLPSTRHLAPSTKYSPWRTLWPRYFFPYGESALESGAYRLGAFTSGEDAIGRHFYEADLAIPTDNSGLVGSLSYTNARFKQPLIELFASQDWENFRRIFDASQQNLAIGMLRRRIREASLAFTFRRPRARTSSFVSLGAGVEARDYAVDSVPLMDRIDSLYRRDFYYPRVSLSAGWSNTQFPPLAISPEDGLSGATTTRVRWRSGDASTQTVSLVANGTAYKSLPLPGFAHHVIALHVAGGLQDNRGTGYFEVGGISSGVFDIFPGYALGEGRRTFSVRGFPVASLLGIRAATGSVEYRAPLALPGRGIATLPLFLDRTSLTLFGDAGTAWCPGVFITRPAPSTSLCTRADFDNFFVFETPETIASVGGELAASAAIFSWDAPVRWRLGFAVPVYGRELVSGEKPSAYFTVGVPF